MCHLVREGNGKNEEGYCLVTHEKRERYDRSFSKASCLSPENCAVGQIEVDHSNVPRHQKDRLQLQIHTTNYDKFTPTTKQPAKVTCREEQGISK